MRWTDYDYSKPLPRLEVSEPEKLLRGYVEQMLVQGEVPDAHHARNLRIILDACDAHPTKWDGRRA